jgi:nucleotide-binding universal stress UspA family protein
MPGTPAVDFAKIADEVLTDTIAEVFSMRAPVTIRAKVVEGNAAQVLLKESAGAGLLVVGSRGRGGLVEALLGSVGQHCVRHATCPVVVLNDSVAGALHDLVAGATTG